MDIRQDQTFLLELIDSIRRGHLFAAAFQRPYVWRRGDVEALWESLLEGWPLGAVMLWHPHGACDLSRLARGRIGPIPAADGSTHHRGNGVILDGQNRLATLAWSMLDVARGWPMPADLSPAEAETWANGHRLVADFAQRRVLFVPAAEAELGCRVPAGILCCDATLFNPYMRRHFDRIDQGGGDAALHWFDDCVRRVRSARLISTSLIHASVAEAKSAFVKICRVGVPISDADFDAALRWAEPESEADAATAGGGR